MKNTIIIFENSLLNSPKENIENLIEKLVFNLAKEQIDRNKNNSQEILNQLLVEFLNSLKKINLLNDENVTLLIRTLIKASIYEEEKILYNYIDKLAIFKRKVENQKNMLKNQISNNFLEFEKTLLQSPYKDDLLGNINDAILFDIEMLGILKETAESAFLTTLEKGEDIELTSSEIAKNLVYNAICETNFEKERMLKISSIILNTTFEIANESIAYAKDLCLGSIKGTQEGIALGIEKFKNSLAYTNFKEDIYIKSKELIRIEDDFIDLLKVESKKQNNPSKKIVESLLENELDNIFAKLKRFASESREQLIFNLHELRNNPKINDFNKLAQKKIYEFKQEIFELEKISNEKYNDLNSKKAKKLGIRLWEKAKKLIKK
ncbi:hypothetical protein DU472_00910 [Campylobacter novaezeelandiae]|uniref:hypothetical protein n=1 Tax=Campylobacter novaezeelandiae TaxID=2267891 RepID=UPI001037A38B|nr:hypothetical protein [Campylobacter novaezeelandiae]QWU79655.1 hypothetical protein CNZW441b_0307 [Campylobacter novaezeelandiae]TBR79769.1 hypothetical protein DU474_03085 [Campylobacter novaezeelandiae]TBR82576.1 hypothetical protein DU472_00910 [Campylobacter novaezeelandiae]